MARRCCILLTALTSAALAACGNPSIDERVEELGDEVEGVPLAFHRAGQPCVMCHSIYGGAEPRMSVAGTIYSVKGMVANPDGTGTAVPSPPVDQVTVLMFDSFGDKREVKTDCVGNFHLTPEEWDPFFPLYAEIKFPLPQEAPAPGAPAPAGEPVIRRAAMGTWIQREGSCNACHAGEPNQGSAGKVYCMETMPNPPFPFPTSDTCEGVP
ncbi:hypothetical protein [Chondromyces apiculatus]|nr:hypothetical protein [Chondromyces apiculatus]